MNNLNAKLQKLRSRAETFSTCCLCHTRMPVGSETFVLFSRSFYFLVQTARDSIETLCYLRRRLLYSELQPKIKEWMYDQVLIGSFWKWRKNTLLSYSDSWAFNMSRKVSHQFLWNYILVAPNPCYHFLLYNMNHPLRKVVRRLCSRQENILVTLMHSQFLMVFGHCS